MYRIYDQALVQATICQQELSPLLYPVESVQ